MFTTFIAQMMRHKITHFLVYLTQKNAKTPTWSIIILNASIIIIIINIIRQWTRKQGVNFLTNSRQITSKVSYWKRGVNFITTDFLAEPSDRLLRLQMFLVPRTCTPSPVIFLGEDSLSIILSINIKNIIIIFILKVAFFHAKLGSDVNPRVDNQTSGDTSQDLTQSLSGKIAISQLSTHGYWSEFLVAGCLSTPTSSDYGRHWNLETSSVLVEFPPLYHNRHGWSTSRTSSYLVENPHLMPNFGEITCKWTVKRHVPHIKPHSVKSVMSPQW